MKKLFLITSLFLVLSFLGSGVSTADMLNSRPFNPGPGTLDPLQAVFTGIGSTINVYTDQMPNAIFVPSGVGNSSASFVAQVTWGYDSTTNIGLYKFGDPTTDIIMFGPGAAPGARIAILFNYDGLGGVETISLPSLTVIDTQANFGYTFGFFLENTALTERWYSEDSLNNRMAQMLIYEGKGDIVNIPYPGPPTSSFSDVDHYYVAMEGRPNSGVFPFSEGNIDFNDYVIQMESITPGKVPEPISLILLGSGLAGTGLYRRLRKPKG